jgi:RNA polymerase sigma-70 factor (ECF subfamily)
VLRAAGDRRPGDAAPSPESAVLADETRATLLAAVNGLRDDDREIIAARYFLDLSEAEAAEALDLPRGTVKSRLSRALGRLREGLAATDGGSNRD